MTPRFLLRRIPAAKSLGAVGIWQIANYAIPLLTLPYLARVLDPSGFGMLGIGVAASAYSITVTDWGFAYTATQNVATFRDDPEVLNGFVWSTIFAKVFLGVTSSLLTIVVVLLIDIPHLQRLIIIVNLVAVGGSVVNVDWLLRGTERFYSFASTAIFGRLATIPLLYLLVRSNADILTAAVIMALPGIIVGTMSIGVALRSRLIKRPVLRPAEIVRVIKEGRHIFISTVAISIYTNSLVVVLGTISGPVQAGIFSSMDKIRRPVQGLYAPLSMVFFPKIQIMVRDEAEGAQELAINMLFAQGLIALCLSAGLCVAAYPAVLILLGAAYIDSYYVLMILCLAIFFVGISNILGVIIMLPFGLKSEFSFCVGAGALVGLITAVPMAYFYGAAGTAVVAVFAEIVVAASMFFVLCQSLPWFGQELQRRLRRPS